MLRGVLAQIDAKVTVTVSDPVVAPSGNTVNVLSGGNTVTRGPGTG
jgi:hypothetical protein